ncbi:putative cadmium-transporting ATPase [Brevibacterium ravenspurgense]|uniref:Putative cadmium-transporting ATPase n=1 Tax=Brevibacterium ravenspurgense TaxID=479117 RepID=A0A150HAT9_9MICO|nr:heavy metal translocating P-type ATPase [Brevibacterium ravenspurgense]KXZ59222.1 putative cadmium-transporting ATPase [Brevibacterium ravenspurgense]
MRIFREYKLLAAVLVELIVVLALHFSGLTTAAQLVATVFVGFVILLTVIDMVKQLMRREFGLDILAVVAMTASLAVGEYLAASIIALMLTGGEALEDYAAARARRDLRSLLDRAPQRAHRLPAVDAPVDQAENIEIDQVEPGDVLLVRPAEVVPVDGEAIDAGSFDESSLTGESAAVAKDVGDTILSGSVNGTQAVRMRATRSAADSQYQKIIALVRQTEDQQAPIVRVADRYAMPFTAVSLLIAGLAWWLSGDPVRFAEVLVLATPCPLLIAAPVAFLGGMSRASNAGIIVKGGAVLEALGSTSTAAFDKTGTLTYGRPTVAEVRAVGVSEDELLAVAAAAEQFSSHVLALGVIEAAEGLELPEARNGREVATEGVEAEVDFGAGADGAAGSGVTGAAGGGAAGGAGGSVVRVGTLGFVRGMAPEAFEVEFEAGQTVAYVSIGSEYAGALILDDQARDNAGQLVSELRRHGFEKVTMLTGDNPHTAQAIAAEVGIDDVHASLLPEDKVRLLHEIEPKPVIMVGDGVNDAPVLAAAGVGIAMGARGDTEASEAADVVITRDDISRVGKAVDIGRWTLAVAKSAIWIGIILSLVLMGFAFFGFIPAVVGALLQEVIDLAAIVYALRALKGPERFKV